MEEIKYFKYHDKGVDVLTERQHTHNDTLEILHVKNGNGVIMINDRLYPLESNSVYFIPSMLLHHSAPEICDEYIRSVVNISESYIKNLATVTGYDDILNILCKNICTVLDKSDSDFIDNEINKLGNKDKRDFSKAIINILSCLSKTQHSNFDIHNQITDIIDYLNKNISINITLENICEEFHISKYYLCHIFKKITGMSIMNYVLGQRITLAKNLIINTEKSISEVAILSGFSCFSYFSRIFKSMEGISPREFRKKYIKK